MFWKSYKTIIPAIVGIIPIIANTFGIHIPTNIIVDIEAIVIFSIGLLAKDFDK